MTSKQRAYLKGLAMNLDPVFQIGKASLTPEVTQAVAEALGDTGRILVRESGTEPLVRVMVEAPDHDTCQKYVSQVVEVIKNKGYAV